MPTKKKTKKKSGGIASFSRMVKANKSLKAAKRAQSKANSRAKKAYKKAVMIAKKKFKSKRK